jgi:predicted AlkP superfamily phosphohydrolase/phosphomutase
LGESDTAAHHFWSFYDPGSPRYQTSPANQDTLARIYRRLDTVVGELSKHAGWVCVVSDHGFGGAGTQALYLNRFLEQQGWLCYRQSAHAQLEPLRQLALSLPLEKLLRRMPASLPGYLESHTRYQSIEFSKTHAWSDELSYTPSIHLNCQGRDPKGILSNRSHAIATLTRLLLDWKIEGKSVVAKVIPREEAMQGPETCYAPDLFLELALENGYSQTLLPSSRVPSGTLSRRLEPFEWPGGRGLGMNGTHRPLGVFALGGPNVQAGEIAASVKDLAPTLLALTGHSIPEHMDGKLLPIFQQTPSIHYTALSLTAAPKDTSFFQQKILQKRLQKLGYL